MQKTAIFTVLKSSGGQQELEPGLILSQIVEGKPAKPVSFYFMLDFGLYPGEPSGQDQGIQVRGG